MKKTIELLGLHPQVSDYKINIHAKESGELFFVKGKLETVRCTDTCDKEVTVYVDHDEFKGESQFFIYPSTTEDQLRELIDEAVKKALLINNKKFELPAEEQGSYAVESNFKEYEPAELAAKVAGAVFGANTVENASLNSVEIFINKHTETVLNSRGVDKTQVRYDAMVEAIPTYNGADQSVELYEQYNFGSLKVSDLEKEIAGKMAEVKARYEAVTPDFAIDCPIILNPLELNQLFMDIVFDLHYSSVYSQSNLFKKGDMIQKAPEGDVIGITMAGEAEGNIRSAKFDQDGMSLGSIRLVDGGKAVNYYGSNRYGQYLGETPTGELRCLCVDAGTLEDEAFAAGPYLEVISMSGLQVDFYSDYIGGEIRLAYYHDGSRVIPVTGISISGKLSEVLNGIRLSKKTATYGGYMGPEKAVLNQMKVF
ncbi:MAG: hypothetical protein IJZ85_01345 [Lachnospiraceae bacterium]|nr:hypothetical protein [Lachnospiraceae bacterium]